MKAKKISCIFLAFGILVLCIGALMPVFAFSNDASVGIIGGADSPTYLFLLFNHLGGLPACLGMFGLGVTLAALFCLIFSKTVQVHCHMVTSAISLGLSAVGATGIISLLIWLSMAVFHDVSKHPIRYPASIALGLASFIGFIGLLVAYVGSRGKRWSFKGVLIDLATAVVYLPVFFFTFIYLIDLIG